MCRVSGFGFRVSGFGFRDSGFVFRVPGFGFRVSGFGFQVSGFGFVVSGLGFQVSSFGFQVSGFLFRVYSGGRVALERRGRRVTQGGQEARVDPPTLTSLVGLVKSRLEPDAVNGEVRPGVEG